MVLANGDKLHHGRYTYTVVEQLGKGRFSITYQVKDDNGDSFVVKTLDDDLLNTRTLSQLELDRLETKFHQEALKLQKCVHPNIVKFIDTFTDNSKTYLLMEYVGKESLATRPQRILSSEVALNYIKQIGEALIVVHDNNLIHRDVKPANILLRSMSGKPILMNFGWALDVDSNLTTQRTSEASDGFAPIELYSRSGQKPGAYTDVYSLAATLYELLTGKAPVSAIKRKLENQPLIPPKTWNPEISDRINQVILSGMELKPEQRPQSIREWLDLLEENNGAEVSRNDDTNRSNGSQRQINWGVIWTAVGAVGTLLAGIAALLALFPSQPTPTDSTDSTDSLPSDNSIPSEKLKN